jgi:hypothetical protein
LKNNKYINLPVLSSLVLIALSACSSFNNPFHPWAELMIIEVRAGGNAAAGGGEAAASGSLVGIRQSLSNTDGTPFILYTYTEPSVIIENKPALPRVSFYKFQIEYHLSDGTVLPLKEYPLSTVMPATGRVTIPFNVMSADNDLRSVVYPGNRAPRVSDGQAYLTLFGRDMNGYETKLKTSFPLKFESLIFSENDEIPVPVPSASSSPQPAATAGS